MNQSDEKAKEIFFAISLDPRIKQAIKLMAMHKQLKMKDYVSEFFREFLIKDAQNTNNAYVVESVNKLLGDK